eukprot:scaffold1150_cov152-Amphora_coffeaeformis.AAC.10
MKRRLFCPSTVYTDEGQSTKNKNPAAKTCRVRTTDRANVEINIKRRLICPSTVFTDEGQNHHHHRSIDRASALPTTIFASFCRTTRHRQQPSQTKGKQRRQPLLIQ